VVGKSYTFQSNGNNVWLVVWDNTVFGNESWMAVEGNDSRLGLVSIASYKNTIVWDLNQLTKTNMSWDLATQINTDIPKFTTGVNGITVNEDWDYKVSSSIFLIWWTNNQRKSVNIRVEINWISTTVQAQSYIRMNSGANESSVFIEDVLALVTWDVVNISWIRSAGTWVCQSPVWSSILSVMKLK
jgi:hypothetical protein